MSILNYKNFIFDKNGEDGLSERLFWKSTCRNIASIFRGVKQNCRMNFLKTWRCYEKIWRDDLKKYNEMFCKTTEICSAKILKICREVFCRTTREFSAKIPILAQQKYREVSGRNTERCSAIAYESSINWQKMSNFLVKIQALSLFPIVSWSSFL